jgi:hypothetical protein
MNEPKVINLTIQNQTDREAIIIALANSGYKVWVVEHSVGVAGQMYEVCFEYSEDEAIGGEL